jgi:caa(3)-type oxidase subunit IV
MAYEQAAAIPADAHHEAHPDSYYIKIWGLLLVLLVVSVLGPLLEHKVITLVTAFGIAIVKAGIVCAYFMHLNTEKSYVTYMLLIALFLMALMFSGISPDVLKMQGTNWHNVNDIRLPPAVHHGGAAAHHDAATTAHHGNTAVQHSATGTDTPQHPGAAMHTPTVPVNH